MLHHSHPIISISTISAISAFSDNYIWAIVNKNQHKLVLVDPGDAAVCIEYMQKNNLQLCAILITHHHHDHVGGIDKLRQYCADNHWPLTIYGPAFQPLPNSEMLPIPRKYNKHTDKILNDGDVIHLQEINLTLNVMSVAGHTLEHIAYYNSELVFCGDALFSAGCGRLFEGTAEQMFNSLTKLSQLSNTTKVYCAHEYTLANLKFSLAAEPNNHAITQYIKHASALRAKNKITLPSTIELEKTINPFLRCLQSEIKQQVSVFANQAITEELDVFTQLRKWKDIF